MSKSQDAVENAICLGRVKLTGHFDTDTQTIAAQYDEIVEWYHVQLAAHQAALVASYAAILNQLNAA